MIAMRRAWIGRTLAIAAAASLALAAGCSVTRAPLVKETFVLEPAPPPAVAKSQPGVLRVATIAVSAPFRGRSFVFRESDLKFETDFYREFLVAPGANIGEATARALAASKTFATVTPAGVASDPDWVLDGFVDALYGDARDTAKPTAVLSITYFLRRGDAGVPVWSRKYERRQSFTAGSSSAYVGALNTALGDILAELSRDLAALDLRKL